MAVMGKPQNRSGRSSAYTRYAKSSTAATRAMMYSIKGSEAIARLDEQPADRDGGEGNRDVQQIQEHGGLN
jgi:hypothetical protein